MTHDHASPDIATMRATLRLAKAVLSSDPEGAAAASLAASCQACLGIATMQLGYALCAALAGEQFVTGPLRARLLTALDQAEGELGAAGN
jgi:hypothetical protein